MGMEVFVKETPRTLREIILYLELIIYKKIV